MKSVFLKGMTCLFATLVFCQQALGDDLVDIYTLAVDNDPTIREARERYEASHTLLAQGRSQLLPSVTVQGTSQRRASNVASQFRYSEGYNQHGWNMNLSQNLLNFEAWYSFKAAKKSDQQAAATLAGNEQDLIIRVASAYFDVLRSRDNLEAFRAEEEAASRILQQSQESFDVGLSTVTDVYQSQSSYDLARVNRLVEENNLTQRLEALEVLTGESHSMLEQLSDEFPIEGAAPADLNAWEASASENNLSIRAAELQFDASKDDARAATARQLPTMTISAGYNYQAATEIPNQSLAFTREATKGANISLNFSYPLFTGGLNSARKRQAYHNRNAAEEVLLRTRRTALQDIRNAYRSVQTDMVTVDARQQAIVSAESALEATEVGAEVGTQNVIDVVLAQRTLYQAQRDYANARYNYVINTLNLKRAAGTLSPQDVMELNDWLQ
jgi:outer membrane protein